jgi:hypothetical protein
LYLLVAGALTPMVVFAVVAALLLVEHGRETMQRDAIGRARSAMSAVDAHLRGSISALETLAASRNLESGDIAAFHRESQRVLRTQPGWVNVGLTSASKIQLSNAVYAFGKPEPLPAIDDESFDAVVRTARPRIGSVAAGNVVTSPTVRVRVPVIYGEEVRYVLSAPQNLKQLASLLEAQRLPEDWAIVLVDRGKHVIVRIPALPASVPESDSFREGVDRSPEGWFQGQTKEGRSAYTSYVTSELSGWILGIAIPASTVEAGERRAFAALGAGVVLALALGALLAWLTAARISP